MAAESCVASLRTRHHTLRHRGTATKHLQDDELGRVAGFDPRQQVFPERCPGLLLDWRPLLQDYHILLGCLVYCLCLCTVGAMERGRCEWLRRPWWCKLWL